MTIVHPPSVDENTDTIEALDWAIPCQCRYHDHLGGDNAAWAVWRKARPCGHPVVSFKYLCDPCWTILTTGLVECTTCSAGFRYIQTVRRTERV